MKARFIPLAITLATTGTLAEFVSISMPEYDYKAFCVTKSVPRTVGHVCFTGFDQRLAHPKKESHFSYLKSPDGKGMYLATLKAKL